MALLATLGDAGTVQNQDFTIDNLSQLDFTIDMGRNVKPLSKRARTFQMVVDKEFLSTLDNWRNAQVPKATRSDAIRIAVYAAADKGLRIVLTDKK